MFRLPELPYDADALAPVISGDTMRTHHGKHHATYVKNTNQIVGKLGLKPSSLEEVVRYAVEKGDKALFNNAAQSWNHAFFWSCMTPDGGAPSGALLEAVNRDLGGLETLAATFIDEGVGHFASGWAWIVHQGGKLKVISTHDAATALTEEGATPILVCDVWEHAYYLDYKNDRKLFITTWFEKLVNWDFAASQLDAATGGGPAWTYPAPVVGG